MTSLDPQTKKLAAIAYGEASEANNPDEIAAIAFAVANRCRAWGGKSVSELLVADPRYTFAIFGRNQRYELFMGTTSEDQINKNAGMKIALDAARRALKNEGADPSKGAYWWDGRDFKSNYKQHPKVRNGFEFGDASHNIFSVEERRVDVTIYWKTYDKKLGKDVETRVRGKYNYVWTSTAAYGETIFWTHNAEYLVATAGKAYR